MVDLSRQVPEREATMVDPTKIRISGPLAAHWQGLWSALLELEYSPLSAGNLLRLAAHLSRWLEAQCLGLEELTHERIEAFFAARRRAGYTGFRTPRSLRPIVRYLEQAGVVSLPPAVMAEPTELDRLVHDYREYLLRERGLTAGSVRRYGDIARRFLRSRVGDNGNPMQLSAGDATAFVLEASKRYGTGTVKYFVTVLRSLLRYLYLHGQIEADLSGALPAVAGWRLQSLPRALDPDQVRRLLRSCDRRRQVGRRDYAVLLLMVRLGLRRGEVAALTLEDVDWREGELRVRGKGAREERLPLPADVGEAIAAYVCKCRPQTSARELFLRVRAPYGPLTAGAVARIVCAALDRAGLPGTNAHRLRHTAATQMLRAGGSLDEIAQVLRHRSHDTTAIYAKVDRRALRHVVRSWPGAVS
jgi:integrase/recombinase XerD